MRGRPKAAATMRHTAIVLPETLLTRLKEAGAASGRGFSGEVRHRLIASLEQGDVVDRPRLAPAQRDYVVNIVKEMVEGLR